MALKKTTIFRSFALMAASSILFFSCSDKGSEPTPNRAPNITSASAIDAVIDQQFSYTAAASDPDGDPVSFTVTDTPSWTTLTNRTVTGTPTAQTPDTSFTVIASDGILADTQTVTITVVSSVPQLSYSSDIQPIFNSNCAGSQCHVGGTANGLSLASYSSLMAGGNSGAVVLPGNPDGSIIVRRLEGNIQPQMPFGRSPLPQATINMIRDWIAQGAHNN